ncbi:hypothetical protein D9M71_83470 [compost metagenome]
MHLLRRLGRQVLVGVAEQHVVKAPLRRTEHAGNAHFAAQGDLRQAHAATGGIPRRPGLARTGIGRVAIGAQGLAIHQGVGDGREQLLAVRPQQPGAHGGGRQLDQHHVIQADAVEGVLQGHHALYLVGLDHGFQHQAHGQRRLAPGQAPLGQMIGHGKDAAQIVGGVRPFGRQPGVVEVQPADHRAQVPGGLHRVHPVGGARHPRALGHLGAFHQRSEQLGAFGKAQGQHRATEAVHQAIARGIQCLGGECAVVQHIVGDGLDHRVVRGSLVKVDVAAHGHASRLTSGLSLANTIRPAAGTECDRRPGRRTRCCAGLE